MTYSVANIYIENQIQVKTGITSGYTLYANSDGTTGWVNVPEVLVLSTAASIAAFGAVPTDLGFVPYGWVDVTINGVTNLKIPLWS
jgi:hypothetical protein